MLFCLRTLTVVISTCVLAALAALTVGTIVLSAAEESDPRTPSAPRQAASRAAQSPIDCAAQGCPAN